jgi:acyl-coenzyme A synthetase/AMP-(fatty) acid ligase
MAAKHKLPAIYGHGDVGWLTADGGLFIVGRTADIDNLSDASVRDISPVYEVEHLLRLEWDATDAAAVLVDDGGEPEIWVGTVDSRMPIQRGPSDRHIASRRQRRGSRSGLECGQIRMQRRGFGDYYD